MTDSRYKPTDEERNKMFGDTPEAEALRQKYNLEKIIHQIPRKSVGGGPTGWITIAESLQQLPGRMKVTHTLQGYDRGGRPEIQVTAANEQGNLTSVHTLDSIKGLPALGADYEEWLAGAIK